MFLNLPTSISLLCAIPMYPKFTVGICGVDEGDRDRPSLLTFFAHLVSLCNEFLPLFAEEEFDETPASFHKKGKANGVVASRPNLGGTSTGISPHGRGFKEKKNLEMGEQEGGGMGEQEGGVGLGEQEGTKSHGPTADEIMI